MRTSSRRKNTELNSILILSRCTMDSREIGMKQKNANKKRRISEIHQKQVSGVALCGVLNGCLRFACIHISSWKMSKIIFNHDAEREALFSLNWKRTISEVFPLALDSFCPFYSYRLFVHLLWSPPFIHSSSHREMFIYIEGNKIMSYASTPFSPLFLLPHVYLLPCVPSSWHHR